MEERHETTTHMTKPPSTSHPAGLAGALTAVVVAIALLSSCGFGSREALVEGRFDGPSSPPDLEAARAAVGEPFVHLGADRYRAGTAFVIEHDRRHYVVTAFHIFVKRNEALVRKQARVDQIERIDVAGPGGRLIASASYAVDMPRLGVASRDDASGDVVLFEMRPDSRPKSLSLASSPPRPGTPVWVVGAHGHWPGTVSLSSDKRLVIGFDGAAPSGMISGAPVINGRSEVVGACALRGGSEVVAAPLASLLQAAENAAS
jgi:hypothetical protein